MRKFWVFGLIGLAVWLAYKNGLFIKGVNGQPASTKTPGDKLLQGTPVLKVPF